MGCFSITCVGSGMSITSGQKAAFIPLLADSHGSNKTKGIVALTPMSMIVANEGANALYKAFSLPIYGEYDDYGSLQNIERNSTVEEIERFFGVDIDVFMEIITRNWCEDLTKEHKKLKNKDVLKRLSGCFFNREIYDFLSSPQSGSRFDGGSEFLTSADVNSSTLNALGFARHEKEDLASSERYKEVWKMEGDTKNVVYSDGTWSHINTQQGLYEPSMFIKHWNSVSDVKIDTTKFVGLNKYHFQYDTIVAEFAAVIDKEDKLASIIADMNEGSIEHKLPLGGSWKPSFKDLYKQRMPSDLKLKEEFLKFFSLLSSMYVNNKILMPMYSGPQCGAPKVQLLLAKKMVEILTKQAAERDDNEDDEE